MCIVAVLVLRMKLVSYTQLCHKKELKSKLIFLKKNS